MNNIKNLTLMAVLLFTATFYGQRKPDRQKIKSLKIAFITERLDLSSSEAEAFWPIYNAHEEKMEELRRTERREIRSELRDLDALSDAEADKLLEEFISLEEAKSSEQRIFMAKLREIISAKKTILLMKTEEDFKRRLIQQYRKNRSGGGYR